MIPDNDATTLFDVEIGGVGGADSQVSLAGDVRIGLLKIDAGDGLTLSPGASLTLVDVLGRAEGIAITNDGLLQLDDASLVAESDVDLLGTGTLELSDAFGNALSSLGELRIGEQQTIRGAGLLAGTSIHHAGLLEALGDEALRLVAPNVVNDGTMRALGAGGLIFSDSVSNLGLVEVGAGSRIELLNASRALTNNGTLQLTGAGATGTMRLVNNGRLEVLDGAVLEALAFTQSGSGSTRVGNAAELRLNSFANIFGAGLELDDGRISSAGPLRVGTLTGSGTIELTSTSVFSRELEVDSLSPGLDGAGLLEVLGLLDLDGARLELELGGTDPDAYDRVTVSESLAFDEGTSIEVITLGGFAPERGDVFELLAAASIDGPSVPFANLVAAPDLDDDLFFRLSVAPIAAGEALTLGVVQRVTATWQGGAGSYSDAASWGFDPAQPGGTVPSNDPTTLYDVEIDGGAASFADVLLDTAATIGRLFVGLGDALGIASGGSLTLEETIGREDSGVVVNDGTIRLEGGELLAEGTLELTGTGVIELSDDPANRIGSSGAPIDVEIAVGQTLRGSGTIDLAPEFRSSAVLRNFGTIEATGSNALVIDAERVDNDGTMRALGSGGFTFLDDVTNRGLIEVLAGSRIDAGTRRLQNEGVLRFIGSGSAGSLGISNAGVLEVLDGARVDVNGSFFQSTSGSTWIRDAELVLSFSGGSFGGTLALDGGTLESAGNVSVGGSLTGNGSILLGPGRTLSFNGDLAPGMDGVGQIDVVGDLRFRSGSTYAFDVAGTLPGEQDVVSVDGAVALELGRFAVSFLDGFAPTSGDVFELIAATSIASPTFALSSRFDVPELPAGLFFVPKILTSGGGQSLSLGVSEVIVANWGGTGRYDSPAFWTFSSPPSSSPFPNQVGFELFDVRIDGGSRASDAQLFVDAAIHGLAVSSGDRLSLFDGGRLTLERAIGDPDLKTIENDGEILIAGGELLSEGPLALMGDGVVSLEGPNPASIPASIASTAGSMDLVNGEGHTIRGGGVIDLNTTTSLQGILTNEGTIHADALTDLELIAGVLLNTETGTLRASGPGTLAFVGEVHNEGLIDVRDGGSAFGPSFRSVSNAGTLRVVGAGSRAELRISNSGLVEVRDGGQLDQRFRSLSQSGDGLTLLANGGELLFGTSFSTGGVVRLDEGRVVGNGRFTAFGRLEGTGLLDVEQLSVTGVLAPGLDGFGLIEVDGGFELARGDWEVDLGGSASSLHDRVVASGRRVVARLVRHPPRPSRWLRSDGGRRLHDPRGPIDRVPEPAHDTLRRARSRWQPLLRAPHRVGDGRRAGGERGGAHRGQLAGWHRRLHGRRRLELQRAARLRAVPGERPRERLRRAHRWRRREFARHPRSGDRGRAPPGRS